MNAMRRLMTLVLAAGLLALASTADAQAIKQLPANPWVVIKVNNPQAISGKFAALAKRMNLVALEAKLGDPLAAIKQASGFQQGINDQGDLVIAIYEPTIGEPPALIMVPVSDYAAFIKGLAGAAKEGPLDKFTSPDGETLFATQRGNYAAVSPDAQLLALPAAGVEIKGAIASLMDQRDAVFYLNVPAMREKATAQIRMVKRFMANPPPGRAMNPQEQMGLAMVRSFMDFMEQFLTESTGGAMAVSFADTGASVTFMADFVEGSALAQSVKGFQNTNASLLAGLPEGKYLAAGGFQGGGKAMWNLVNAIYGPMLKGADLPPEKMNEVKQYMDAMETMLMAMNGMNYGLLAPAPGQQGLFRGFFVMDGNSAEILAAQKKALQFQDAIQKAMGQDFMKMTFTEKPKALTVAGVTLDAYTVKFEVEPNAPEAAMIQQMMTVMYGGQEVTSYVGALGPDKVFSAMGVSEQQMTDAINAIKAGKSALDPAVKTTADALPKERGFVTYVWVDQAISAGFDIAKRMGAQIPPFQLPKDLPPLGATISGEGNAVRMDLSMPNELIDGIVGLIMQAAGGGNAPPPGQL